MLNVEYMSVELLVYELIIGLEISTYVPSAIVLC